MRTYILFIFCEFNDFDEIEFFCTDVLGESNKINQVKYIVQNLNAIVVILDSDADRNSLEEDLQSALNNENILFYFGFEKSNLFMLHLPENMKDIMFKPKFSDAKFNNTPTELTYDLDVILDKIRNTGIESLTVGEKKFLDNFGF